MTTDPTMDECDAPGCDAVASMLIAVGTCPPDDPDFPGLTEVKLVCEDHKAYFQMDVEAQAKFVASLLHTKRTENLNA